MPNEQPSKKGLVVPIQLALEIEGQLEQSIAFLNIESQLDYPYQYSIVSEQYQIEFRFLKPSEGEPYKIDGVENPSNMKLMILQVLEQNLQSILLQGHLENYKKVSK